jgi:hypothetical protein
LAVAVAVAVAAAVVVVDPVVVADVPVDPYNLLADDVAEHCTPTTEVAEHYRRCSL